MSASDKKKLRKEEKSAKLTERQIAEQKEAKKLKVNSIIFVTAIVLIFVIAIVSMGWSAFVNSGIRERNTVAVEIAGHKLTVVELNYFYTDLVNSLPSDWERMMEMTSVDGLNSSAYLDEQLYKNDPNKTWGDRIIEMAVEEAAAILALCDEANAAGYTLSEAEKTDVEDSITAMETQAYMYGYTEVNDFLKAIYGPGANVETYRTHVERMTLAQSYLNHYAESKEYSVEEMEAYEAENGSYSAFDYIYFQVSPKDFLPESEDGTYTDEQNAAALSAAEEAAKELVNSGASTEDELNAAIAANPNYNPDAPTEVEGTENVEAETGTDATGVTETTEATENTEATESTEASAATDASSATESTDTTGTTEATEGTEPTTGDDTANGDDTTSTVPTCTVKTGHEYYMINTAIGEWLTGADRKEGEIGYVPYYALDDNGEKTDTIECYYVVIYQGEDKHETKTVAVRHILIGYQGGTPDPNTGNTVYSDTEKKAAEDKIKEIQAEFEATDKSPEAFGELAKKYTTDSNGDVGGLYENVYPGMMVATFNDWCFDESRKAGDVGIVHTEYGCHLIYFVEQEDQTHREYMITTDMRADDSNEYYNGLRDKYFAEAKIGDVSYINTHIILAG